MRLDPAQLNQGPDGETPFPLPKTLYEALTGETAVTDEGCLTTTLPPISARLWLGKKE